jgi:HSP20 family protein
MRKLFHSARNKAIKKEVFFMDFRDIVPWKWDKGDDPFVSLKRMNRLFEDFSRGVDLEPSARRTGAFEPRVNVAESDREIKVSAELPGIDEKDIDISLSENELTIKGEKKEEKEEKKENYYRMERSYGSFSRVIPLPCKVDSDKVEAQFKKGVLNITLPKSPEAVKESKKIEVKPE